MARERIESAKFALKRRGPDADGVYRSGELSLIHTRLSILDLDERSDQPFTCGKTTLIYNGETWNWKGVRKELESVGRKFETECDTEVVATALDEWGTDALPKLNGMFAAAWTTGDGVLRLARDRFGEVPLHVGKRGSSFLFASELKALLAAGASPSTFADVGPGERVEVDARGKIRTSRWHDPPIDAVETATEEAASELFRLLKRSVRDRAMSDVPVCTLLSGGIDSAAVAMLLREVVPDLVAYVAVLDGEKSTDVKRAREVAEFLGIELREVSVAVPSASDLSRVVGEIEMPFKAQVEIGWPCLKLAEAMRGDGFKVTFSGEGSDELWASYGFAYHGLKKVGWHEYRKKLFLDQSRKNFPRANKAFMTQGVECRLPFLHPSVVEFALSLPRGVVQAKGRPKAVMQEAFRGKLPDSVVDRSKVAFQDGMGLKKAIAASVPNAKAFYAAEFGKKFGGGVDRDEGFGF